MDFVSDFKAQEGALRRILDGHRVELNRKAALAAWPDQVIVYQFEFKATEVEGIARLKGRHAYVELVFVPWRNGTDKVEWRIRWQTFRQIDGDSGVEANLKKAIAAAKANLPDELEGMVAGWEAAYRQTRAAHAEALGAARLQGLNRLLESVKRELRG